MKSSAGELPELRVSPGSEVSLGRHMKCSAAVSMILGVDLRLESRELVICEEKRISVAPIRTLVTALRKCRLLQDENTHTNLVNFCTHPAILGSTNGAAPLSILVGMLVMPF